MVFYFSIIGDATKTSGSITPAPLIAGAFIAYLLVIINAPIGITGMLLVAFRLKLIDHKIPFFINFILLIVSFIFVIIPFINLC